MSAGVAELTVPSTGKKITVQTGLFINNKFVPSVDSQEKIECVNPATEEVLCSVSAGSVKDIDVAVAAAREAFNTTWGKNVSGFQRSKLLNKLADLMERDAEDLAALETLNNGKPFAIARDGDVADSVGCLRYYAGWADKITGQSIEVEPKTKFAFTKSDPIGVCGQILVPNAIEEHVLLRSERRASLQPRPHRSGRHSMELSDSDVGVEGRSCSRSWLHHCHEAQRVYSFVSLICMKYPQAQAEPVLPPACQFKNLKCICKRAKSPLMEAHPSEHQLYHLNRVTTLMELGGPQCVRRCSWWVLCPPGATTPLFCRASSSSEHPAFSRSLVARPYGSPETDTLGHKLTTTTSYRMTVDSADLSGLHDCTLESGSGLSSRLQLHGETLGNARRHPRLQFLLFKEAYHLPQPQSPGGGRGNMRSIRNCAVSSPRSRAPRFSDTLARLSWRLHCPGVKIISQFKFTDGMCRGEYMPVILQLFVTKLSELIVEAGFPPGVVNTVPSLGSVGGAALSSHKGIDKVAFTGSTVTGRKVMKASAESNLKKVSLELGGKSPHLVFESANLEEAAKWAALGILYNTGQDCTAGSRVYVQDSVYDKFLSILISKTKELTIGDGFAENVGGGPVPSASLNFAGNACEDWKERSLGGPLLFVACLQASRIFAEYMGYSPFGLVDLDYGPDRRRVLDAFLPIIALVEPALWAEIFTALWGAVSKVQYDKIWSYIESGKEQGATLALGGVKRPGKGYYVDPTIFTDITPDMKIVQDEIFGPVLSVGRFKTEEEAIKLANDTTYGLGAGLHSNDANQCIRVSDALEAGTVWINMYNLLHNNVPFGGKKQSGIGRELGSHALEEYISHKAIQWNFGEKLSWPL
ncbi:aldehyde dehydrogenase [Trametopsis cervina]|nr:aldehyde dehydrogenase [Trametopsis cervina]